MTEKEKMLAGELYDCGDPELLELWHLGKDVARKYLSLIHIYHGLSAHEKIEIIQEYMKENDCQSHIVSTLDDIAWIFNIRGSDIPQSPTVMAFALITLDQSYLYLQNGTYDLDMVKAYQKENILIKGYHQIYDDVAHLKGRVLLNTNSINYQLFSQIAVSYTHLGKP